MNFSSTSSTQMTRLQNSSKAVLQTNIRVYNISYVSSYLSLT